MARVTVEDCVTIIPNRFELVLLAAQRARDVSAGVMMTVERDNDKNAVVALREISEQSIDFEELRRHIVRGVNRHADLNFEDDNLLALAAENVPTEADFGGLDDIQEVSFEDTAAPAPEEGEDEADLVESGDALEAAESLDDIHAEADAEASDAADSSTAVSMDSDSLTGDDELTA